MRPQVFTWTELANGCRDIEIPPGTYLVRSKTPGVGWSEWTATPIDQDLRVLVVDSMTPDGLTPDGCYNGGFYADGREHEIAVPTTLMKRRTH